MFGIVLGCLMDGRGLFKAPAPAEHVIEESKLIKLSFHNFKSCDQTRRLN